MPIGTESLLTALFDFQRFERDPVLQREIDEVEESWANDCLSDEMLRTISAAGDPCLQTHKPKKRDEQD